MIWIHILAIYFRQSWVCHMSSRNGFYTDDKNIDREIEIVQKLQETVLEQDQVMRNICDLCAELEYVRCSHRQKFQLHLFR